MPLTILKRFNPYRSINKGTPKNFFFMGDGVETINAKRNMRPFHAVQSFVIETEIDAMVTFAPSCVTGKAKN